MYKCWIARYWCIVETSWVINDFFRKENDVSVEQCARYNDLAERLKIITYGIHNEEWKAAKKEREWMCQRVQDVIERELEWRVWNRWIWFKASSGRRMMWIAAIFILIVIGAMLVKAIILFAMCRPTNALKIGGIVILNAVILTVVASILWKIDGDGISHEYLTAMGIIVLAVADFSATVLGNNVLIEAIEVSLKMSANIFVIAIGFMVIVIGVILLWTGYLTWTGIIVVAAGAMLIGIGKAPDIDSIQRDISMLVDNTVKVIGVILIGSAVRLIWLAIDDLSRGYLSMIPISHFAIGEVLFEFGVSLFLIGAAETMREWIGSDRMRRLTKLVDSLTSLVASNNATECAICLDELSACLTRCGHHFCPECLLEWLLQSDSCPICRQSIANGADLHAGARPHSE